MKKSRTPRVATQPATSPADGADGADGGNATARQRPNRPTQILGVLSTYDTFTDTDGVPYLSVPLDGRLASMEVMSEDCKNYLDRLSYEQFHAVLTDYETEQVRGVVTGQARFDSPSHPVYLRVAPIVGGGLCIDLGTADGRAVVITKAG